MAFKDQAAKVKYNNEFSKQAYDHIHLTLPKGEKDVIKGHAMQCGESVNAFIARAIAEAIERDTTARQEGEVPNA